MTAPQQSLVVNLSSQKDAILDGIDDTLRVAPCEYSTGFMVGE